MYLVYKGAISLAAPLLARRLDLQGHEQWTHAHAGWRSLSALLRLCNSQALLQLWPAALPALQQVAADHERDPRLRLELLHLAAALLADDSKAGAWQQAGAGQLLVRSVLLPALVWRAGRVPAAVRYAALTALVTLLSCQRLPAAQLAQLGCEGAAEGSKAGSQQATAGSLLGQVAGCMDEDYEPDTRQLACHTLQLLLASGMCCSALGSREHGCCCSLDASGCSRHFLTGLSRCPNPCALLQWASNCPAPNWQPCNPTCSSAWTTAATACAWRPALRCSPGCWRRLRACQREMPPHWPAACCCTWMILMMTWQRRCAQCWSSWQPPGPPWCDRWRRRRQRSTLDARSWTACWPPVEPLRDAASALWL